MDKLVLSDVTRPMTQQPIRQSSTDDKPLKKCDRVEAYDIDGKSVNGTVKWIGRHKEALPNGAYIVGIHTVSINAVLYCTQIRMQLCWKLEPFCNPQKFFLCVT